MHALEWHGTKDVRLVQRAVPMVTDSTDVVVRITATTICGSDLHLFHNEFLGMEKSDVLGHEFVGAPLYPFIHISFRLA
jgi:threonine dehydrogenase-like Zn-dependent dehydrogenase